MELCSGGSLIDVGESTELLTQILDDLILQLADQFAVSGVIDLAIVLNLVGGEVGLTGLSADLVQHFRGNIGKRCTVFDVPQEGHQSIDRVERCFITSPQSGESFAASTVHDLFVSYIRGKIR